jgi:hypothetical protein
LFESFDVFRFYGNMNMNDKHREIFKS